MRHEKTGKPLQKCPEFGLALCTLLNQEITRKCLNEWFEIMLWYKIKVYDTMKSTTCINICKTGYHC